MLHNLGKIADTDALRPLDAAGSGLLLPRYEFHEGTLAGAVLAHQTYLVPVGDVEVDAVQKVIAAEGYRYVIDRYHALQSRMESSYRPYSGMASTNMEKGSLGVMKAARMSTATTA